MIEQGAKKENNEQNEEVLEQEVKELMKKIAEKLEESPIVQASILLNTFIKDKGKKLTDNKKLQTTINRLKNAVDAHSNIPLYDTVKREQRMLET